jgi:hypothetical protein
MARGGGCGCSWRATGGFYPSVMGGVATTGPYFVTAVVAQAARLIRNERQRMSTRRRSVGSARGKATRRSKRTRRAKKNATHRQKYALQA